MSKLKKRNDADNLDHMKNMIVLKCSACGKPLAKVWSWQKNSADIEFKIAAQCCYCSDRSFQISFKGLFAYAGYGLTDPHNLDNEIPVTDVIDIQPQDDGSYLISTKEHK